MFCGKCGAQNPDDAVFCKECGAPMMQVPAAGAAPGAVRTKMPAKKRNLIIGIGAAAVALVLVVVLAVTIFGGRSYESTAEAFVEATFEADGKAMMSLIPEELIDELCDEEEMSKREFRERLTEELEEGIEYLNENSDDWSYSYKITDTEDLSKKELKSIKEDYEDEYDITVKDAKTVTIKIKITLDGEDLSNSMHITVIKVGGSWYVDPYSMDDMF